MSTRPNLVVFDSHPKHPPHKALLSAISTGRTQRNWEVNSGALGSPQSRMRTMYVSVLGAAPHRSQMAILYLLYVCLPQTVYGSLENNPRGVNIIEGNLNVTTASIESVLEPAGLCYIHLPRDRPSAGARWSRSGTGYIAKSLDEDTGAVQSDRGEVTHKVNSGHILPTNYQVFSPRGVVVSHFLSIVPCGLRPHTHSRLKHRLCQIAIYEGFLVSAGWSF